jgi:subtilisin family serine protease
MRFAIFGWFAMFAAGSAVPDDKVAPELLSNQAGAQVNVIVQFTTPPSALHHQKVVNRGGKLKSEFGGIIRGAAYSMPVRAIADLARDPEVTYIAPDRPVQGLLNYSAAAVNAAVAWSQYGLDGSGIGVAVIDSGISNHQDLMSTKTGRSRVVFSQDFVDFLTPHSRTTK